MKIERLSQDKIRIFLTFDDLTERGIKKEDMWREIPKVHELFSEMMDQAYNELGFDASGPLAVEVFTLPAQGMVVIVTRGKMEAEDDMDEQDLEAMEDDIYEMEVTLEQSDLVSFAFDDFEHLLSAAKRVNAVLVEGGFPVPVPGKMDFATRAGGHGRTHLPDVDCASFRIWGSRFDQQGGSGGIWGCCDIRRCGKSFVQSFLRTIWGMNMYKRKRHSRNRSNGFFGMLFPMTCHGTPGRTGVMRLSKRLAGFMHIRRWSFCRKRITRISCSPHRKSWVWLWANWDIPRNCTICSKNRSAC